MSKLEFIQKLYNGKNCYSDHMSFGELDLLHIKSKTEEIVENMVNRGKIVFLTGNPGDGKTFIIKALKLSEVEGIYLETDLNNIKDYDQIARNIIDCYNNNRPAVIAVNEYPFMKLCKKIRDIDREVYSQIQKVKKQAISYGANDNLCSSIVVLDLNERNLLGEDYNLLDKLIDKMVELIEEDSIVNLVLRHNVNAFSNDFVKEQILKVFTLVSAECEHFAIRDIVGALAFALTACTKDEDFTLRYYDAIFEGSNDLLKKIKNYDPIYLSCPEIDEMLWNGEIQEGWILETPTIFPKHKETVDEALDLFKSLKRKYYFENIGGKELFGLQPSEIVESMDLFKSFESKKRRIKESIVRGINKLFLPTSDDKRNLHVWSTHRYDMSLAPSVTISGKIIDASDLEVLMPRPVDWLSGLEYVPNHLVLKHKNSELPKLILDIDFLRTLKAIENGYPIGMLAPQYEQSAAMFLQKLDDNGLAEINDEEEIIVASRKLGLKQTVRIQNDKYNFEEVDE